MVESISLSSGMDLRTAVLEFIVVSTYNLNREVRYSVNQYVDLMNSLSIYYAPNTVPGAQDAPLYQTDMVPATVNLVVQ